MRVAFSWPVGQSASRHPAAGSVAKLEATTPEARELKQWDQASLRVFVESYQIENSFGDPESKKAVMNTLIASALLDGDHLSITPNYPGFTGVKRWRP